MNTFAERTAYARTQKGLSQSELAHEIGITPQAVQKWEDVEKNVAPRGKNLEKLAEVLGRSKEWLLFGSKDSQDESENLLENLPKNLRSQLAPIIAWDAPDDLDPDQYVIIPHVDVVFSAGDGRISYNMKNAIKGLAVTWAWIRDNKLNPKKLLSFYLDGDSMAPTVPDKSVVTVDTSKTELETDKEVFAIRYGDDLKLKRLSKRYDGALIIESDNPKYETEIVKGVDLEHIAIFGRYVSHTYTGKI